ncbi:hypothetical protein TorRG33x02_140800 [Trema orientale]|uniref:Uncharacterized protein n=1 Tax=Trema orientale TaxID=63057 RepID=A0A2P5EWY0_TREOI|nr:hypothetical protein TorRG33x02_140800 [Trema orientale]
MNVVDIHDNKSPLSLPACSGGNPLPRLRRDDSIYNRLQLFNLLCFQVCLQLVHHPQGSPSLIQECYVYCMLRGLPDQDYSFTTFVQT